MGMTNGEKIKEIFPDTKIITQKEPTTKNCESCEYYGSHHEVCNYCYKCSLWTEQDQTTKNDLALIHTEGLDEEIRCTMCTNHMKSDRGCDGSCVVNENMYKAVMDAIEKRIQPTTKHDSGDDYTINGLDDFIEFGKKAFGVELTIKKSDNPDTYSKLFGTTKNDLGVDAVSRKAVITIIQNHWWNCRDIDKLVNELPSVTPQLSSELEKNSKKLEKDFGESDCIDRAELLKAIDTWDKFGYTARYGLERLDKDDKGFVPYVKYDDIVNCIINMSSVTPQESKTGHWIFIEHWYDVGRRVKCSECGQVFCLGEEVSKNYCANCGAKMVEPQESEE